MGRPLNKRYFGDPSNPGPQFQVLADLGSGIAPVYIVRQRSSYRFEVTDGVTTKVCKLVDGMPSAPGEMAIVVSTVSGTEYARVVHAHRVKTFQGNDYPWMFAPAPTPDKAVLPYA